MSTGKDHRLHFIFERRSIRVYSPGEVPPEVITHLLEAAMAAPSAMTRDPWRFVVVREKETLGKMAGALPGGKMLVTAAAGIVVCGDIDTALDRQMSYLLQDCSAATENLLLAAHAFGLGACWVGVHPAEDSLKSIKQMLFLPSPIIPIAVIALGWPGEQPGARTRYHQNHVHFERW
jgi:nitroreductase